MRNFLIAMAATCLFMPPACLFTPTATAQTDREMNRTSLPAPSAVDHGRKTLTIKGGTLLNSNPTPEEAKKWRKPPTGKFWKSAAGTDIASPC